jgi:ABC-2 type transport system permease protein
MTRTSTSRGRHRRHRTPVRPAVRVGGPGPAAQVRWAVADTATMARRLIMVWLRKPSYLVLSVLQPVLLVLLLRYSIGGAVAVRVAGGYFNFLIPGAVAQAAAFTSLGTGMALAWELQSGVIDRLRAMPMSRAAILGGPLTAVLAKTGAWLAAVTVIFGALGIRAYARLT